MKPSTPKLPVGGLKLSQELVQIRLFPKAGYPVEEMFRRLADRKINLTGVVLEANDGHLNGMGCILAEDRLPAEEALRPFEGSFEILGPVGTLTVFPHQGRLELFGRLLSALGNSGISVYGIVSSFSSLTIILDYPRLDEAVSVVCAIIQLPENHAPLRPEFRVKQL
jgi:hypothetical protein